jgi:alpha-1,2-mannosyltransferase
VGTASVQRAAWHRWGSGGRVALLVAAACALLVSVGLYMVHLSPLHAWHGAFDLKVYRGAVIWWLDGNPLYSFHRNATPYGFTYPPFAALTMLPLSWVSELRAQVLSVIASSLLVVVTTWWLVSPVAARHSWPRWFAVAIAVPLAYLMEPVRETIAYGQVNLFLVALVLLDMAALARGSRFAGVGIGLAAAIKLTPGLFILYLVLTGRWRQAGVAMGTFLAATLAAFAVGPGTSVQFWTRTLFQTERIGRLGSADNQSVLGLLTRLAGSASWGGRLWVVAALAVLVVGMVRARQAWRRGDELVGITLTGLTSCLVSPISWTHHLYWIVPAALVLVDIAAGAGVAESAWSRLRDRPRAVMALAGGLALIVMAVFGLSVVWLLAHFDGSFPRHGVLMALGTSAYALTMLALLVLLPARGRDDMRSTLPVRVGQPRAGADARSVVDAGPASDEGDLAVAADRGPLPHLDAVVEDGPGDGGSRADANAR